MITLTRARDDAVDHAEEVILAREANVRLGDEACTFHEHLLVTVHHDFGDRRVTEERIDRPVPEHVVDDGLDQPRPLLGRQPLGAPRKLALDDPLNAPAQFIRCVVERSELRPDLGHAHRVQGHAQVCETIEQPIGRRSADPRLQDRSLVGAVVPVDALLQRHVSSSQS
jgi:hypothetical protein